MPEFSLKIGICLTEEIVQWTKNGPRELLGFRGSHLGEKVTKILLKISPKSPKSWRDVL